MLYSGCMEKCKKWRKYSVIAGGILIYLPIGVPWYFGNLATYINSYYRSRTPAETDLVDPQWIFSAFFVAFSLAIIGSGYSSNMYGPRPTLVVAIIIHSGASFLSYLAIQHSMAALIVTFGAVGGLGAGLAYGPPLPVVIKWMPRRVGLASGVLMTGFGGGAIFYNELITFFINPDNSKPDVMGKRTTYFSQPEVLARVPQLFVLLGALTVVLQLAGVILLREVKDDDQIEEVEMQAVKPVASQNGDNPPQDSTNKAVTTVAKDNGGSNPPSVDGPASLKEEKVPEDLKEMAPTEMLRTPNFYILWTALAFNHYGYIIKNNYYKEFGQVQIDDDHFLTTTGTLATIGVSLARLLWGLATDWLGTKLTLLIFTTATAVSTALWFFTLHADPALFMFWVILVSAILTGAFILFPLAVLRCFGENHYATNYGVLLSAQIVVNLISPPIIRQILINFGWFWLFFSISIVNLLATCALLLLTKVR